jgi:hypothetical protein
MFSQPRLPRPRGIVSEALVSALAREPQPIRTPALRGVDWLDDDDAQLALWCFYQVHYSSFAGVCDGWEWEPGLLALRKQMESHFVRRLLDETGPIVALTPRATRSALRQLADADGPSLSRFLLDHGTYEQVREFLTHRSIYQRKEADPHTWTIPRLHGRPKAAMVTIQCDEYGAGVTNAMHAELFAETMRAFGLDTSFAAYLNVVPGFTLATDNLVSMFGLHREWRAASVGHLALFEMTSVAPMGRYARALERLGAPARARRFYDVHVQADEEHQRVALDDMVVGLLEQEPAAAGKVVFGAKALAIVEGQMTDRLLQSWAAGESSLLPRPVGLPGAARPGSRPQVLADGGRVRAADPREGEMAACRGGRRGTVDLVGIGELWSREHPGEGLFGSPPT